MYKKELEVAISTIKQAKEEILKIYYQGFNVSIKSDNSVVTNADLASENIIKEALTKNFPTYAILSEESKDNIERLKDYKKEQNLSSFST